MFQPLFGRGENGYASPAALRENAVDHLHVVQLAVQLRDHQVHRWQSLRRKAIGITTLIASWPPGYTD
jgi:hypothetical protein